MQKLEYHDVICSHKGIFFLDFFWRGKFIPKEGNPKSLSNAINA